LFSPVKTAARRLRPDADFGTLSAMSLSTGCRRGWLPLLVLLLLAACVQRPAAPREHPLGFALPLAGRFTETTFRDGPGMGVVHYLSGDELDAPRLTVRVEAFLGSVGGRLEELALVPERMELLEEELLPELRALNAEGQGLVQRIRPLPEAWPELVLRVEQRVYLFEDRFFCLRWEQAADEAASLERWRAAVEGLRFRPAEPDGSDQEQR
jgi:hypothetical protein